jgi:hypothetical protein
MTITVPTGDLVGVLADVIPFASTDKEDAILNTVRLEWDGDMLHALATDRVRIGWSTWHPDDEPDGEAQDDLFTKWGSGDDPWSVVIPLGDAKDIVDAYKLPVKEQRVPLTLDAVDGSVRVIRSRDTGHSAITIVVPGQLVDYPDVPKLLGEADRIEPVSSLAYGAKLLGDFSKVRPRGPMELTFTGPTGLTHIAIGKRFIGAIMPTRLGDEREREAA